MRPPPKPLRRETLSIDSLAHGEALAAVDVNRAAFFGGAPGDRVQALLAKRRKGVHPGWIVLVEAPGPRVEPRCPHFAACGGCTLQHLDYAEQVRLKAVPLEVGWRARGAEVLPAVPAPSPYYYRSKVELSFDANGHLGFYRRRRFDQVVDVEECFLAPSFNRRVLGIVREWARGKPGWNPRTHEGHLRYLVLRESTATRQWLAVIVTAPGEPPQDLADRLLDEGATGVVWVEQTSVAGAIVPEREHLLAGRGWIEEGLGDLRFELSWRSFFQSNPPAYLAMLDEARRWVGRPERLLDLFCGIGTIGLYLNPHHLVGVESVEPAVLDARRNAERNGRQGEFHVAQAQDFPHLECDWLVLDPPRSGCHPKLVKRVNAEGPAHVLYISCNPERLSAELDELTNYRVKRARLYDFFPQTRHIEGLLWLERL